MSRNITFPVNIAIETISVELFGDIDDSVRAKISVE